MIMKAAPCHPAGLLHSFAGMPSSAAGAEGLDLQFACAFNLPAVLHTLGPPAWPALHPAFDWLTGSGEARNRCTLACSLHEIARMVGPQIAQRDLMRAARVSCGPASAGETSGCLLSARSHCEQAVSLSGFLWLQSTRLVGPRVAQRQVASEACQYNSHTSKVLHLCRVVADGAAAGADVHRGQDSCKGIAVEVWGSEG